MLASPLPAGTSALNTQTTPSLTRTSRSVSPERSPSVLIPRRSLSRHEQYVPPYATRSRAAKFKLNKTRAMTNISSAARRSHMCIERKSDNIIITFSSAAFHVFRKAVDAILGNVSVCTEDCDCSGAVHRIVYKRENVYTLSLYTTTLRALINGPCLSAFSEDFPEMIQLAGLNDDHTLKTLDDLNHCLSNLSNLVDTMSETATAAPKAASGCVFSEVTPNSCVSPLATSILAKNMVSTSATETSTLHSSSVSEETATDALARFDTATKDDTAPPLTCTEAPLEVDHSLSSTVTLADISATTLAVGSCDTSTSIPITVADSTQTESENYPANDLISSITVTNDDAVSVLQSDLLDIKKQICNTIKVQDSLTTSAITDLSMRIEGVELELRQLMKSVKSLCDKFSRMDTKQQNKTCKCKVSVSHSSVGTNTVPLPSQTFVLYSSASPATSDVPSTETSTGSSVSSHTLLLQESTHESATSAAPKSYMPSEENLDSLNVIPGVHQGWSTVINRSKRLPRRVEHLLLGDFLLQSLQRRRLCPKGSMHIRSLDNAGIDTVLDYLSTCDLHSETTSVSFLVGKNDPLASNMPEKYAELLLRAKEVFPNAHFTLFSLPSSIQYRSHYDKCNSAMELVCKNSPNSHFVNLGLGNPHYRQDEGTRLGKAATAVLATEIIRSVIGRSRTGSATKSRKQSGPGFLSTPFREQKSQPPFLGALAPQQPPLRTTPAPQHTTLPVPKKPRQPLLPTPLSYPMHEPVHSYHPSSSSYSPLQSDFPSRPPPEIDAHGHFNRFPFFSTQVIDNITCRPSNENQDVACHSNEFQPGSVFHQPQFIPAMNFREFAYPAPPSYIPPDPNLMGHLYPSFYWKQQFLHPASQRCPRFLDY